MHCRHGGIEGNNIIVNMAVATSHASHYRDCRGKFIKQNIEVPHYTWFWLQFWPCSRTAYSLLHYKGCFKVKLMVQARIFWKHNPDSHYCTSIYNFIKQKVLKQRANSTFFTADAKQRILAGEIGFPLACVAPGQKIVVISSSWSQL